MNAATPTTITTWEGEVGQRPSVHVWGRGAMVSSMHPDATYAGLEILSAGGNAVDAALAVGSVLAVTNHNWSGAAGDSVWLIHDERIGTTCLDGYSTCPASLTADVLIDSLGTGRSAEALAPEPGGVRDSGVLIAMVPGTPALWAAAWRRFGSLPISALVARAVDISDNGTMVTRYLAGSLRKVRDKLSRFPASRAVFFRSDGEPLREGDVLVQKDLARTFERFAARPEEEFAFGEAAGAIVACAQAGGSPMSASDLAAYRPVFREPVAGRYRGYEIKVTPPPTAGAHVLQALAILDRFDLAALPYHSPESLHLTIGSLRAALAERRNLGGDPDHDEVDVDGLLNSARIAELALGVRNGAARPLPADRKSMAQGTTHFVVRDKDGMCVSATQTIGSDFGCGEVAEGSGLLMNDRTWWMSLDGGPNVVGPNRRANIGHAPTIVFTAGEPWLLLGSPGGFGIVQYVVQVLVNVIDYGLDVQAAIEAPRFRLESPSGAVFCEDRFPEGALEQLAALGHRVERFPPWTDRAGGVAALARDKRTGHFLGGYDVRRNALAAGF